MSPFGRVLKMWRWDLPGSPMVKTPPFRAGGAGLVPGPAYRGVWPKIEKKKMWHFPNLLCLPDLLRSSLKKWAHTRLLVWNNDNKKYHNSQEFRLMTVSLLNSQLIIIIGSWLLIYSLRFPAFSLNKLSLQTYSQMNKARILKSGGTHTYPKPGAIQTC